MKSVAILIQNINLNILIGDCHQIEIAGIYLLNQMARNLVDLLLVFIIFFSFLFQQFWVVMLDALWLTVLIL